MNGTRMFTTLALATGLVAGASFALADDTPASGAATKAPEVNATTQAAASVDADAAAKAKVDALRSRVTAQSAKVSAASRTRADEQLSASAKDVDAHATGDQQTQVAERLGKEFSLSTDAIVAEKTSLDASWGDLTIAHSLAAKAGGDVDVASLMALKQGGMGWGQIAAGLGLKLGSVVSGVKANSAAATGMAKAGGNASAMHGASAKAGAGAGAGVGKGVAAGAKVDAGVKVGGKLKP